VSRGARASLVATIGFMLGAFATANLVAWLLGGGA
jgi:hypothetical protein